MANARPVLPLADQPACILSLIMLAVMFYMVIIPLYRMLMTTITFSENDLRYAKDAVVGDFTLFHWLRMLTSKIGMIMTYRAPAAFADHLAGRHAACHSHRRVAGLDGGPHRYAGQKRINVLATVPYIMPSWTIAMAWKVMFNNGTTGGMPGIADVS